MSKENKDEKIQVLLSSSDFKRLKNIIINWSMVNETLITSSAYVRELILNHIKKCEREQESYINDIDQEIIEKTKLEKNQPNNNE